ncbi:MAG: carbohydrate kinase family protein [Chloroflexota bacterium]
MNGGSRRPLSVVAVGEALIDLIAPDAPTLAGATEFLRTPGGAPANVAVAVSRLGSAAAFVGAVGTDSFGQVLSDMLAGEDVDISGLQHVPERTTLAFVARNAGGIPDFVFYRGADAELRPEDVPLELLASSSFVYVSSMALLSEPSAAATLFAMEAAREAETLVAVDPNLRPSSWPSLHAARSAVLPLASAADVLKVNNEEARLLAGTGDLDAAMRHLARDDTLLVVTLGADGCRWQWSGHRGTIGAPTVAVRDTTGAGDAFMGALLHGLAEEGFSPSRGTEMDLAGLGEILRFACAAGAVACTHAGAMTGLPRREEVEELLGEADQAPC